MRRCSSAATALLLAAASKVPMRRRIWLAGALNGAAIDVVQAETFDAVVPAHARSCSRAYPHRCARARSAVRRSDAIWVGKMEKIFEIDAVSSA